MSGSDEMNIRLWKAVAWEHIGPKAPRQAAAEQYAEKLKSRFKAHPEIGRIARHRHLPKEVYNARKEKRVMEQAKVDPCTPRLAVVPCAKGRTRCVWGDTHLSLFSLPKRRREDNLRQHRKPGAVPYEVARKKNIVREEE